MGTYACNLSDQPPVGFVGGQLKISKNNILSVPDTRKTHASDVVSKMLSPSFQSFTLPTLQSQGFGRIQIAPCCLVQDKIFF